MPVRRLVTCGWLFLALTLLFISGARANDENWRSPGWYQVFGSTGYYLIYSGPYESEDACWAYVNKATADEAYMSNMRAKYGRYNSSANGDWTFFCPHLPSADSAGDISRWRHGPND